MPIEPTAENLLKVQTELTVVRAKHTDLTWKIQQRRLCEHAKLEKVTIGRAHRIRDQMVTAPARHAAVLAAQHGIAPGALSNALDDFLRTTLAEIAAGPG